MSQGVELRCTFALFVLLCSINKIAQSLSLLLHKALKSVKCRIDDKDIVTVVACVCRTQVCWTDSGWRCNR